MSSSDSKVSNNTLIALAVGGVAVAVAGVGVALKLRSKPEEDTAADAANTAVVTTAPAVGTSSSSPGLFQRIKNSLSGQSAVQPVLTGEDTYMLLTELHRSMIQDFAMLNPTLQRTIQQNPRVPKEIVLQKVTESFMETLEKKEMLLFRKYTVTRKEAKDTCAYYADQGNTQIADMLAKFAALLKSVREIGKPVQLKEPEISLEAFLVYFEEVMNSIKDAMVYATEQVNEEAKFSNLTAEQKKQLTMKYYQPRQQEGTDALMAKHNLTTEIVRNASLVYNSTREFQVLNARLEKERTETFRALGVLG